MNDIPKCQLYLISPLKMGDNFPDLLHEVLSTGSVAAFQFRVKDMESHEMANLATPLQLICAQYDVAFIINDYVNLAKRLKADGVHLGQGDGSVKDARIELGPDAQIGVTCHNSKHLAMEAGEAGADYVAFGAFFDSSTKDAQHRAEIETLKWWANIMEIPSVAIGGITAQNAKPIIEAGADFVAVSGAIWNHPQGPKKAIEEFQALLA
ncbi:thiamine-phosphate diphosphorylase [Sphingorhabdus lutea]|uniref:Thiamine-phosphate synthase n=1 Tax=Sphingorhabdus lutea TaxID=1913578 RepID=A0A1L3JBS0_9SPHN|nr:thiamine phosphate synthase [Sphingorhabdus lutea]APG62584.1 thiamine-phosphate diphosphorylase [Sphingorhabdus lutea]